MWCQGLTQEVLECEGFSFPCYYKLMCSSSLVCNDWKKEFCGGQTSLIEVSSAEDWIPSVAKGDDWIPESFGLNSSFGSTTQQMPMELSTRAKRVFAYDMHLSKTNEEADIDVDSLSGLDASVKGKCTR
jgi:hypothetical protein